MWIGEISVNRAELTRLFGHQLSEILDRSPNTLGQNDASVVGGGQQGSIKQIVDCYRLTGAQVELRRAVERDGVTLIVAILGASDQWGDTRNLLEYGFENIEALRTGAPITPKPSLHPLMERLPAVVLAPRQANAAEPSDAYVLQLGTFRDAPRAEALSKRVKAQGFSAFVEKISAARNQSAYRVRVGPYVDRARAREVADQLLSRVGYKAILLPVQARLRSDAG